jgi:hypothetical protein
MAELHARTPKGMIVPYECPEIIILRAKKKHRQATGNLVDYADTPFTRRARKNLERINNYIADHHINLDITDAQEEELLHRIRNREDPAKDNFLDFTKTRLSRIFNNSSFEQGGRFYGPWWQQIPGDYRTFITINSKKTVELDYSGMHFAIMYADMEAELPMLDPYALDGYGDHLKRTRTLPLSKMAVDLLKSLDSHGKSAYVFPNPTTGKPYRSPYKKFNSLKAKARMPKGFRFHDCRHWGLTQVFSNNHSLETAKLLAGHSSSQITERYLHCSVQALREPTETIAKALENAINAATTDSP